MKTLTMWIFFVLVLMNSESEAYGDVSDSLKNGIMEMEISTRDDYTFATPPEPLKKLNPMYEFLGPSPATCKSEYMKRLFGEDSPFGQALKTWRKLDYEALVNEYHNFDTNHGDKAWDMYYRKFTSNAKHSQRFYRQCKNTIGKFRESYKNMAEDARTKELPYLQRLVTVQGNELKELCRQRKSSSFSNIPFNEFLRQLSEDIGRVLARKGGMHSYCVIPIVQDMSYQCLYKSAHDVVLKAACTSG